MFGAEMDPTWFQNGTSIKVKNTLVKTTEPLLYLQSPSNSAI